MRHVFISYCDADADFAAILAVNLERQQFDTWMDKTRLRPGEDWSQEIDDALLGSLAVVVVISPDSRVSEYVTYEWSFAIGAGLPVLPVLYRATDMHPRLRRLQYLDFTNTTVRPWQELASFLSDVKQHRSAYSPPLARNIPEYIRRAALALDSPVLQERFDAMMILWQSKDPSARDVLKAALHHPLEGVRWRAAIFLRGEEEALPELLATAKEKDAWEIEPKGELCTTIAEWGERIAGPLCEALKLAGDDNTALIEGVSCCEQTSSILAAWLHETDPALRMKAIRAMPEAGVAVFVSAFDSLRLPTERAAILKRLSEDAIASILDSVLVDGSDEVLNVLARHTWHLRLQIQTRVEDARPDVARTALKVLADSDWKWGFTESPFRVTARETEIGETVYDPIRRSFFSIASKTEAHVVLQPTDSALPPITIPHDEHVYRMHQRHA